MNHLTDSRVIESSNSSRVVSDSMTRDLDDPINEDLNFVIIYHSAVRFHIYTPSLRVMTRESNDSMTRVI